MSKGEYVLGRIENGNEIKDGLLEREKILGG